MVVFIVLLTHLFTLIDLGNQSILLHILERDFVTHLVNHAHYPVWL